MSWEKESGLRVQAKSKELFDYEDALRLNRDPLSMLPLTEVENCNLNLQLEDLGEVQVIYDLMVRIWHLAVDLNVQNVIMNDSICLKSSDGFVHCS